jgi:hypothetical protein
MMMSTQQLREHWRFVVTGLVLLLIIIGGFFLLNRSSDIEVEFKQISTRQETVQLESESGISALRELRVAGRAVKPDLPLDESKVRAIAKKIVTDSHPTWKWRTPTVTEKTDDELGTYWEARYHGRESWWQLWRPNKPTLIITVHAKTRVYDVKEEGRS